MTGSDFFLLVFIICFMSKLGFVLFFLIGILYLLFLFYLISIQFLILMARYIFEVIQFTLSCVYVNDSEINT